MRLLILTTVTLLTALASYAADVSGDWIMSLETPNGALAASLNLKQDGDKVTGTYRGPRNEAPAAGTMKDNDLKLSASINGRGQSLTIQIAAKVADDKMEGTLDIGGQASVGFKATKKP